MKRAVPLLMTLVLASWARSILPIIPDSVADSSLAAGNNRFALQLFGQVCEGTGEGNVFFSPFSISMALGMTWNGATGETAREMASVLHFDMPVFFVNQAFSRVTETITSGTLPEGGSGEPFEMTVSNGLWVQDGFQLLNSFTQAVTEFYQAGIENLDFAGDPEGARETINEWVAESTMQKILNLIPSGGITPDIRLVLTNAVYFKAGWLSPFEEMSTWEGAFTTGSGTRVMVPLMHQTEYFDYALTEELQALRMPYAGGNASMLLLLPHDMEDFLGGFGEETLAEVDRILTRTNVDLTMPRFEYSESISLGDILVSMGMETAFTTEANFTPMTGSPDLFISQVLHKAYVKVDEKGTEAAAATAVLMALTAAPQTGARMMLDRPFVFLIQNDDTGTILFMGLVNDPS